MVSPLWKACADGDLQKALDALNDATAVDVEVKDHTGSTPLIEAVRNGHVDVVKALLEKGADPNNASSQGRPDQYTSDPAILELLHDAQSRVPRPIVAEGAENRFYPSPPEGYTYYPTINPSLSTVNEGGVYYPPSQVAGDVSPNGAGNLPPPEVARMIPCRYFPACRYGAQCMFAHPQTPYFQGGIPHQYPPYDPMGNPYVPQYYPPPPPSFQQPPGAHPLSPMSPPPGPPVMHARSPSEVISPSMGHFSPNGAPPPSSAHYGHISPPLYPHPSHVPMGIQPVPLQPLPQMHQHSHPANSGPQPHPNLYNVTSPVPTFPVHQDASGPYPMPPHPANINYPEPANGVKLENGQAENYTNHTNHPNSREGPNSHRRGGARRASFSNSRKPPCLFFPSGRCKNGVDCRFPHVSPENGAPVAFPASRSGPPRARGPTTGHNGFPNIENKMSNMSIRDDLPRPKNGVESSSRSHSSEGGNRPKFQQAGKNAGSMNGHGNKKTQTVRQQQRLPNADDFPVLAGSVTPPLRNPGANGSAANGTAHSGPTAAQVLQAPAPRKDSKESSTRGTTPDPVRPIPSKESVDNTPTPHDQPVVNGFNKGAPMSFAAAATSGASAPADLSKEVSVSA